MIEPSESKIYEHESVRGKITDVTVFLNGAQLTRAASLKLASGLNKITFSGISADLYAESLTASTTGDCQVTSVSHQVKYITDAPDSGRVAELLKKKREMEISVLQKEGQLAVCAEERILLERNRKVAGKGGLKAGELKETLDFFKSKLTEIENEKINLSLHIEELHEQIHQIDNEVGRGYSSKRESEISVEVYAPKDVETDIELSYFLNNAGWTPYYDIRAKDVENPVTLNFKAFVRQQTGEDWEDVKLTLSTGNPSLSGNLPELMPLYVDFEQPVPQAASSPAFMLSKQRKMAEYQSFNALECISEEICVKEDFREMEDAKYVIPQTVSSNNLTGVEYALPALYSIPSSYNQKPVDIKSHQLKAEFKYYSIRKLEKDVFLVASVTDWTDLNLLEGAANIFFEGKYVGKSYIDPRRAGERISLSLGRDPGVIVTRVKGKDMTEKSLIGSNTKVTKEWTLTARNVKGQAIDIEISDQLPVSVNKSITIEPVNISGAEYDKDTGKLKWNMTLDAGKSKTMTVKYTASYPKNKIVVLE
ncbi:DUF4139 domain-containing protein [Methanolapillus millepedarum]|uniref:Mucoidy inhibitor MuiA family protein n=1 Tax=Methanolapillus millepedarum TaxID=3028296 RepID=A0AA96V236_9EURY|nr:hypothetical protein MsAc7_05700 [Methanosarcinaceae archaeon Ac7]